MASKLKEAKGSTAVKRLSMTTVDNTKDSKIPKGAEILKKDVSISVEEIENGFITTKNFDIKYQVPGQQYSDYCYYSQKWFTKENPLEISDSALIDADGDGIDEKDSKSSLADLFDM